MPPKNMTAIVQEMFSSSMHDLNNTSFVVEDGTKFEIAPDAHRWEKLGKKVLIIDVDSRLDLDTGAMLNQWSPKKESMKGRTGGILNHFLYGKSDILEAGELLVSSLIANTICHQP